MSSVYVLDYRVVLIKIYELEVVVGKFLLAYSNFDSYWRGN